jgi:hypothetical protein
MTTESIIFDRQEVFNAFCYDVVKKSIDAFSLSENNFEVTNMLYGLYDGVLYSDLISAVHNTDIHPKLATKYDKRAIILDIDALLEHIYYYLQEQ